MAPFEVSGEANPLDLRAVYDALAAASSSAPQQIQTGTKQLQNWEKQPNYYSFLQVCSYHLRHMFSVV